MTAKSDGLKSHSFRNSLASTGRLMIKHKEKYVLDSARLIMVRRFSPIFPIFGLSLAFKQFIAKLGLFGSPWIGLYNFNNVFADPAFLQSIFTTLKINAGRLLFVFPFPILFALMINEVRLGRSKKILQSIFTFPNFLSWVIVASIMISVLGQRGLVNSFLGGVFNIKAHQLSGNAFLFSARGVSDRYLENRGLERDHLHGRHRGYRYGTV